MVVSLSEQRWAQLFGRLGKSAPLGAFADLVSLYCEPHRHYHTAVHIDACLTHFDRYKHLAKAPDLVELALWLHDVIYDTQATDNEARSAAYAEDLLRRAGLAAHAPAVTAMILATTHTAGVEADDAGLVVDLDLGVLAAPAESYRSYCLAVRQEFSWVPEPLFRAGRSKVLRQLAGEGRIYAHPEIAEAWEAQARENLQAELLQLEAPQ